MFLSTKTKNGENEKVNCPLLRKNYLQVKLDIH